MKLLIGILLFAVFLLLSAIHIYWGFGGRWGSQAVFPTPDSGAKAVMPRAGPTFLVAAGLLAMGICILLKTGLVPVPLPGWLDHYDLWLIAAIFLLRAIGDFTYVGFFKRITHTPFGRNDTRYYSPLCLAIGLLIIALTLIH